MAAYRERLRRALNSPEFRGARPRQYERREQDGMIIERDVIVPTRCGHHLYVDLFRPANAGKVPPLVVWTPYGKHDPAPLATIYPASGVQAEWQSDLTIFEAPDPVYWTGQGYAVVIADTLGTWYSDANASFFSPQEARAHYDLIEWAGVQEWSNGKVGLSGVSYLASSQWKVAALRPPYLAAINPWEGWSDTYNEIVRHGGIPETFFWPYIQTRWGVSENRVEDLWAHTSESEFFDEYWQSKVAKFEDIEVPAYVVASWSDHGVHTRGTLEGYKRISSPQKWLEVHGSKKWAYYYEPQSIARQTAFFDYFLKGEESGLEDWPEVRLHVRDRAGVATQKSAQQWPVEGTDYRKLYLDASAASMRSEPPTSAAEAGYDPLDEAQELHFDYRFEEETELVGHMKLRLFVSIEQGDDMDIFVALDKLEQGAAATPFVHWAVFEDAPLAFGWLRLSRRELDPDRSTEFQPVLANRSELKVRPGEVLQADIEILPSGTRFAAGDVLRLRIKGRDIFTPPKPQLYSRHEDTVNSGTQHLHTGPEARSYLLVPVTELPETS